jgi:hypothetical protein
MFNYIKSFIKTFFGSPTPIVFIEPIEEEVAEKPTKKTVSKPTKHKPRARKKKVSTKAIYPYYDTPVGNGFMMKNQMNGTVYRKLKDEGIVYRQHRCKKGVLAFRVS